MAVADQVIDLKEKKIKNKPVNQLPEPSGYKILITIPEIEAKTRGGILKPDKLIDEERVFKCCGLCNKSRPGCLSE